MEKVTLPKVRILAEGKELTVKQMQANASELMPLHHANLESIVFIYEGECILRMNDEERLLKPGEAVVIPPLIKHQFKAIQNFKGIHFMPDNIKFDFFKGNK